MKNKARGKGEQGARGHAAAAGVSVMFALVHALCFLEMFLGNWVL